MIQYAGSIKPHLKYKAKHRSLFELSGDAIYISDRHGRFTYLNKSAAGILGYTVEELLEMKASSIYADPAAWESLMKLAQKNTYARDDSIRLKNKGGVEIVCMMTATVRAGSDGRILGYQGSIHDMTEHEQKGIALRESEERFRQLSDASFEGILIHENGDVLFCNRAYARMIGYAPEEMTGKPVLDFVAPEDRNYVLEKTRIAYQYGFARIGQVIGMRRNGTKFTCETSARITYYEGRKVLVVTVQDISDRTRMEKELRESEEKLRIMFESIIEGVIVYDVDGLILQLNDATVRLHGFQCKEELIGRDILNLIAAKDHARAKRNMKMRLQAKALHNIEYVCLKKDGSEFSADWGIGLIRDKSRNPVGHVAVIRDVTERKRAELNKQFYISEITKAHEEERRRLARELHDETVQSLIALSLDIEAINKAKALLPVKTVEQLKSLQNKTNLVVDEVRSLSHKLRPSTLDKLGLVPAIELLVDELVEKKIKARFETIGRERRLPPDTEVALFRITQEALRNVLKHSQATASIVEVCFIPRGVRLTIEDNGRGFDVTKEDNRLAGRGKLGLIGMKERAALIGGVFSIESQSGKGTTVTVEVKS